MTSIAYTDIATADAWTVAHPTKVVFTAGLQAARKAPKAKKEDANKKAA